MVPSKKGAAPYILLTGSQVVPQRYFIPRDFIDGRDSMMSVRRMPSTKMTIAAPIATSDRLKSDSARICPLELFTFFIFIYQHKTYSIWYTANGIPNTIYHLLYVVTISLCRCKWLISIFSLRLSKLPSIKVNSLTAAANCCPS